MAGENTLTMLSSWIYRGWTICFVFLQRISSDGGNEGIMLTKRLFKLFYSAQVTTETISKETKKFLKSDTHKPWNSSSTSCSPQRPSWTWNLEKNKRTIMYNVARLSLFVCLFFYSKGFFFVSKRKSIHSRNEKTHQLNFS